MIKTGVRSASTGSASVCDRHHGALSHPEHPLLARGGDEHGDRIIRFVRKCARSVADVADPGNASKDTFQVVNTAFALFPVVDPLVILLAVSDYRFEDIPGRSP